jgi:intracellular multiplication protein IcmW
MASFSLEDAHKFWSSYDDPNIYKAILFMDANESWTLDGDEVLETHITKLSIAFEKATEIKSQDKLIKFLSIIKTSRVLYILQNLDNHNPGTASRLLMYAEEKKDSNEWANLLLKRNVVFERLRILSRLFSPQRLQFIQAALEGESNEE